MKASFTLSSATDKAIHILAIIPVLVWVLYPNLAAQANNSLQNLGKPAQIVFEVNQPIPNSPNTDQTSTQNNSIQAANNELALANAAKLEQDITRSAYKDLLRNYLTDRGSTYTHCVDTLVDLPHADKIISLSAAESSYGRRTKPGTFNYWGVGGSNLWRMGNDPCEALVKMNDFLANHPRKAQVKYAHQTIEQMNCHYKQPCGQHWVNNNNAVLRHLANLKGQARQIAQAKPTTPVTIATATIELVTQ